MLEENREEIRNFRDIGGARSAFSATVRRGLVFRSAALDGLNEAQRERISQLGIRLVVDFRSGLERAIVEAPYAADGVRIWHAPDTSAHGAPQQAVGAFLARPPGDKSVMQNLYRTIPFVQAAGLATLYNAIAENELPLVFHCAAGKDRTGVATALLLDMLGVSRGDILADYRLSSAWFDHTRAEFLSNFPDGEAMLAKERYWQSMLQTDESYLEAMFEEIEGRHSCARGYMIQELGMTGQSLDRIASLLLE